jgi:hypothetical protein
MFVSGVSCIQNAQAALIASLFAWTDVQLSSYRRKAIVPETKRVFRDGSGGGFPLP